ncbi:MAG TPA: hypothetical protein VMB91_04460 [Solirubrobacteraceae bacterium]|nr:hypothetical protein [Solirubrobacteraceae bacterium]
MALVAVVLAALAGASVAAVSATGQSGHPATLVEVDSVHPARVSSDPARLPEPTRMQAAAEYLGISVDQLTTDLEQGESLGQIAAATPGRSESGLIAVLVANRRSHLAKEAETLPKRLKAAVAKPGGPGSSAGRDSGLLAVARSYLGISATEMTREMRSGKTLADIAESTPGRSREGLAKALFAAREHELETAAQTGRISESAHKVRLAHVERRVERILSRDHHKGSQNRHAR